MLDLCFQYQSNRWLMEWDETVHALHPAHIFLERISHMEVGKKEVRHYLSSSRSSLLNQRISASQAEFGTTPALYSQSLLRRNSAGIGFKNKAVAKQKLALACHWASTGNNAQTCQFFTWNAGNLQRRANMDTLNDLLCQPWHLGCVQEG